MLPVTVPTSRTQFVGCHLCVYFISLSLITLLFYIIGNKKALLHIIVFSSFFLVPFIVCFQCSQFMIMVELCMLSPDLVNEITR